MSFDKAEAKSEGCLGPTRNPVCLSTTSSVMPPTLVATTGSRLAIATRMAELSHSEREGRQKMSKFFIKDSLSERNPVKMMLFPSPSWAAF